MCLSSKNILIGEVIPTYVKVRMHYVLDLKKKKKKPKSL